jgi:hypothetical protein
MKAGACYEHFSPAIELRLPMAIKGGRNYAFTGRFNAAVLHRSR